MLLMHINFLFETTKERGQNASRHDELLKYCGNDQSRSCIKSNKNNVTYETLWCHRFFCDGKPDLGENAHKNAILRFQDCSALSDTI